MSRNVVEAAKGSGEISQNIQGVAEAAEGTSSSAREAQNAADRLTDASGQLRTLVDQFKVTETGGAVGSNSGSGERARSAHA